MRKVVEIDGEKLRAELQKRGINGKQASEDLGYASNSAMSKAIVGNRITKQAMILLENLYNIKPESYEVKAEVPEEDISETKPTASSVIDYDKLYQSVYDAVYEAMLAAYGMKEEPKWPA